MPADGPLRRAPRRRRRERPLPRSSACGSWRSPRGIQTVYGGRALGVFVREPGARPPSGRRPQTRDHHRDIIAAAHTPGRRPKMADESTGGTAQDWEILEVVGTEEDAELIAGYLQ